MPWFGSAMFFCFLYRMMIKIRLIRDSQFGVCFFSAQFCFQTFKSSNTFLPKVVIASVDLMPFFVIVIMLVFCSNYFLLEEEFAVLFIRQENVSFSWELMLWFGSVFLSLFWWFIFSFSSAWWQNPEWFVTENSEADTLVVCAFFVTV